MHPVLLQFNLPAWLPLIGAKPIHIYTYGVMMASGFILAIWMATRRAKRIGEDPERILDLCFWVLVSSIAGARLFYVMIEYRSFMQNPLSLFAVWQGGLVYYGGFIGAFLGVLIYTRRHKMLMFRSLDILMPSLLVGHLMGRFGCFFAGCCFGKPTQMPWAIIFRNPRSLAPRHVPLHPTQLYEVMGLAVILAIILRLYRKPVRFDGQIFFSYILMYAVFRSFVEIFRGDKIRGFLISDWLSTSQGISALLFALALYFYIRKSKASS